jgi:phosphopantothenoylcysteine decarboxylase/phosphopantothenate--cysteine ligase
LKNSSTGNLELLKGRRILINAGPTREKIDPVRFISNYSTGRMGIALADAAAVSGAAVELVLGPVNIRPSDSNVKVIDVESAEEMASECIGRFENCDIAILAAAVADYSPVSASETKIKKSGEKFLLPLKPTTDIAAALGKLKRKEQILAGFALETDNEIQNAVNKLKSKNLDLIVLNSLRDRGAGFGFETNVITIIDRNNIIDKFELKSKEEAARDILAKIVTLIV